jgi:hypothetical protein
MEIILPSLVDSPELRMAQWKSNRFYNLEARSKVLILAGIRAIFNRHGAEEARGAHNSEVTRSKRVAGMITIQLLYRSSTVYTWTL